MRAGGLLEAVALALELQHGAAGCMWRSRMVVAMVGISQVFAPSLHHAVGGDDDGAAQLVALVHDGLQDFGGMLADDLARNRSSRMIKSGVTQSSP